MMEKPEGEFKTEEENESVKWLERNFEKFSNQLSTMGKRFNYDGVRKPIEAFLDENGKHLGVGMCQIASAAIEEAVIKRFGDRVETSIVELNTPKIQLFSHAITRIILDGGDSISVDGSHRQIDRKRAGLLIIPTETEDQVFQTRDIVKEFPRGSGSQKIRREIEGGRWRNITIKDFDNLVATLTQE